LTYGASNGDGDIDKNLSI